MHDETYEIGQVTRNGGPTPRRFIHMKTVTLHGSMEGWDAVAKSYLAEHERELPKKGLFGLIIKHPSTGYIAYVPIEELNPEPQPRYRVAD